MTPRHRRDAATAQRILSLLVAAALMAVAATAPIDDFEKCRAIDDFGNSTLICDPHQSLKNTTVQKLESLLRGLQENAKRPQRCLKDGAQPQKYVGLLQVVANEEAAATGMELRDIARRIYDSVPLGNDECDNGVLIFYLRDKQQLATYNGNNHFVLLTNADIDKLHKLASGGKEEGGGALALQFLRGDSANEVQRAETWAPVVGLTAALVLILLILALCVAVFVARFCCCGKNGRTKKKNKYYVTPVPTYKAVDPIYIVTPAMSERHDPHADMIYSTPYSGTPLPQHAVFGPAPPPTAYYAADPTMSRPGSRVAVYGRSVTPSSLRGVRVAKSADPTPRTGKKEKVRRSGTTASKRSSATYQTMSPSQRAATSATANDSSDSNQTPDLSAELPFLDPRRRRETQTREEFVE